ncbi:MAG: Mov34/MPN/PAD-1 family protein [Roseiflexaceae bacterium]
MSEQLMWLCDAYPYEAVGLLLGTADGVVMQCMPTRNLAEAPRTQFVLDPQVWLDADVVTRRQGWHILGVIHSHPDAPARPSHHDQLAGATLGTQVRMVIVQVGARGIIDITAWRWDGAIYQREHLQCH